MTMCFDCNGYTDEQVEIMNAEREAAERRARSWLRPVWVWLAWHLPLYRWQEYCAFRAGMFDH
jgi:hypothetical protein